MDTVVEMAVLNILKLNIENHRTETEFFSGWMFNARLNLTARMNQLKNQLN